MTPIFCYLLCACVCLAVVLGTGSAMPNNQGGGGGKSNNQGSGGGSSNNQGGGGGSSNNQGGGGGKSNNQGGVGGSSNNQGGGGGSSNNQGGGGGSSNNQGGGFVLPNNFGCQALFQAIKQNPFWTADYVQKVLRWAQVAAGSITLPSCSCNSTAGGYGSVSSIRFTDPNTGAVTSNSLCSACPGLEQADADFRISANPFLSGVPGLPNPSSLLQSLSGIQGFSSLLSGLSSALFGNCNGLSIFRCSCPSKSSTAAAITTPKAPTTTQPTTTLPTTTQPTTTLPVTTITTRRQYTTEGVY